MATVPRHLEREMGFDLAEFMRPLAAALGPLPFRVEDGQIRIDHPQGPVTITPGPVTQRRIASLAVPSMRVSFDFGDLDAAARQSFLARFDRHYQRGGG